MTWRNLRFACGGKVFVCYRREDTRDLTGRIYDRLRAHFGARRIFMDVDSIHAGQNFPQALEAALGKSRVLLVVIGDRWLCDDEGHSRLEDRRDFVRMEIEAALRRSIPIVPVLAGATRMPPPDRLPASIRALTTQQALPVRGDPDFHRDMGNLVEALVRTHGLAPRRLCLAATALAGAVGALGATVALVLLGRWTPGELHLPIDLLGCTSQRPLVEFTRVPPLGSFAHVQGRVRGVTPAEYRVVVYIFLETCSQGWWGPKPYWHDPLVAIGDDGSWSVDFTTGGCDEEATRIAAYVVPATFVPPALEAASNLPRELEARAVARATVHRPPSP